ncbi:phage/plasmid replication protein, II/X family [Haemophilus paraphrohaemolyticus]|uniref:Phage X family protein n=1 Tax=Haemophilus paraphrohaemolyticus HK411 TaxID=1095743 RepID=I2NDC4_9PAST|nr:phage/plasmid replication protein, II/X family [Haemophilus paraphrohaemolyticus]EIG23835.1 phage X family protein [Haemophilus paraphrohaemolyticus HK411]STP01578.1 phage/plasmid replication protein, gene II/X family [Haemophilus paraphrohaemolyticus]
MQNITLNNGVKIPVLGFGVLLDSMPRNTFWRYEKDLIAIGLTKAQLQNLKSYERHNIIPLMKLVEIDFSCQRPDWYVEPTLEKWGIAA